jgi:hypothetical protein
MSKREKMPRDEITKQDVKSSYVQQSFHDMGGFDKFARFRLAPTP